MPKTRLTNIHRAMLNRLAELLVSVPKEQKAADDAYEAARTMIILMINQRFPREEMKILKKWACGGEAHNLKFQMDDGGWQDWKPRNADNREMSWTPNHYEQKTYTLDKIQTAKLRKHIDTEADFKKALCMKLKDYRDLITASTNFEDVVIVWPEAEQLRTQIGAGKIMVSITPDAVQRIQHDVRVRAKAKPTAKAA